MSQASKNVYILGISAYYHDSAAALLCDGKIVAAAQEERFTRKKHDEGFPTHAVSYCLKEAGIKIDEVDLVAFYEKPLLKFERLMETYAAYAPLGFQSFRQAMHNWLSEKLWIPQMIQKELGYSGQILYPEHHESHAASAFFPSPFKKAAFLTTDGVGEWATTSWGVGDGHKLEMKQEIYFPHSIGLLYSAFTYYLGFKVNSGEYKVMGLAPYGEPKYVDLIKENLIDIKADGSYALNMDYFKYPYGLTMTNQKFHDLFGGAPRQPESELTQKEMDIAKSLQVVTEEVVMGMAKHIKNETGAEYLCLSGGVALNCVSNGKLLNAGLFRDIWIQPASGDAGGALGAALFVWHQYLNKSRETDGMTDSMSGAYLGPSFNEAEAKKQLDKLSAKYQVLADSELMPKLAKYLDDGSVIGWFTGRMEYGPRALGHRSIVGDPRNTKMQSVMNLKIKYRESFRPFAPSVLEEYTNDYFMLEGHQSPYMLLTAPVVESKRKIMSEEEKKLFGIAKLNVPRSKIPAITHVDYSARVQSVSKKTSPRYHKLISAFNDRTGCPLVVNTSFNVRGEPIVCTPEDAYRCFMRTEMDYLVIGNMLLMKSEQLEFTDKSDWRSEYELD